jgi:hypothetical protein
MARPIAADERKYDWIPEWAIPWILTICLTVAALGYVWLAAMNIKDERDRRWHRGKYESWRDYGNPWWWKQ